MSAIDKYLKEVRLLVLEGCCGIVLCQTYYDLKNSVVTFDVIYEDATHRTLNIPFKSMLLSRRPMSLLIIQYFCIAGLENTGAK